MMSARPTAASAPAIAMEKRTKIKPVSASGCGPKRQKAIRFRFAAFSISSMPMSTRMACRRVTAPAKPMAKRKAEISRQACSGVMIQTSKFQAPSSRETSSSKHQATRRDPVLDLGAWCFSGAWMLVLGASFLFLLQRNDNCADHCGGQHQADDFERQDKFRHQRVADVFDGGHGRGRSFFWNRRAVQHRPAERGKDKDSDHDAGKPARRQHALVGGFAAARQQNREYDEDGDGTDVN